MNALYLESSAALAWLFGDTTAPDVIQGMDEAEIVVTSQLTIVETERAIHRAVALRSIKEASAQKLRGLLARERKKWITMALPESVLARAGAAFPVEPVSALDAIHLATALAFSESFPDLKILAFDRRVSDNAAALGLAVAYDRR
jgi:predicted nucleic acid-binding protein